ncbi:probable glutamate carboxypeptidase LAMP1 [Glycine max]|uniref:probable glutamate carboxypeptidase LAMP1 n=1 Tax=Glycine max TaxID=3847 RepID=UPI001B356FCF|nr:probable glutamate carboxypeptidase LAMP1 [Glycine max]
MSLSSLLHNACVYFLNISDDWWKLNQNLAPKKYRNLVTHNHTTKWGLVALWLADEEFLPFDYLSYAKELQLSVENLEDEISNKDINLSPIFKSIKGLEKAAIKIDSQRKEIEAGKGWITGKKDHLRVRELNDRLMMAERAFTDRDGLFECHGISI